VASIEARIDILLSGMAELNKLQSKLDAIQATADQISKQGFDVELGRVSDLGTYSRALKTVNQELEKTTKLTEIPIASLKKSNAEISKTIGLESRLRRERSLVSRYTREFSIETKGLDQSKGQLKDIKDRFDELNNAFGKAFKSKDTGLIRTLRTELSSLVQEQRDWNRTLTGTKKTGVNADFLNEQAAGYREQIDALKARAKVLADNEDIIGRLAAAERNLVTGRSKEGTFLPFADPRLGRQQLSNATKLIQEQEKQQREAESAAKTNERLSSAAVALEKQRQSALEKIFQVEEKIRSSKRISFKDAQDYYFQAQLPRPALPFGDVNQPARRGGARQAGPSMIQGRAEPRIREVLGGARTADEAAATLRLAQATQKLSQATKTIDPQYNRFLPDEKMLNASGRGIQRLTTSQEEFNQAVARGIRFQEKYNKEQERLRKIYGVEMPVGTARPGGAAKGSGSGLQQALKSLREARGARASFLDGASPAEAIDQIIREFNTGKPAAGQAAGNITQSFASGLKKGAASSAAAAKSFAGAAAQAIKDVFGIKSPSRFMIELVMNLVNTYIAEMQKSYPRIRAATEKAFGEQTLTRNVKELRATSKGFEFVERPSRGLRPFLESQGFGRGTAGATQEFSDMMLNFRKQIAELTTQPDIFGPLLRGLPDSRITTDLIGAANRRATASELPSFMSTQRMLGPGELEREITRAFADFIRTVRTPDPWVGLVGDYKKFIDGITATTRKLTSLPALPPARVAGALPPSLFASGLSPAQELRRLRAYQRSQERSRAVMEGGAARGLALPPARGIAGALPPAAQRGLQDAISDLFSRISSAVRGAFGGAGGPRPPAGGFAGAAGGGGQGGQAQQIASLLGLDALGDISRLSTRELEALSGVFAELRAVLDPTIEGFDRLDNQLRETIGNIGRQVERRDPNADFLTRRFGPRAGRGISEGLIGGAFPLLFGQGLGASVFGLAGGAAGGFAGGGLGFGLSLIGTALGTSFDTLSQAAQDTGKALNYPIEGFDKLKEAGLFASRQQEYYISKLIETGQTGKAAAEIQSRIVDIVGVQGANDLMDLGDAASALSKKWAELNTQMQALVAGPVGDFLNLLAKIAGAKVESNTMTDLGERISKLTPEQRKAFQQEAKAFSGPDYLKGAEAILNRIAPQQLKEAKQDQARQEEVLNKSIENADKSRAIIQQGVALERSGVDLRLSIEDTVYGLRKRATDMEREAAEFRRSIEDEVFGKRQELEQKLAENERKRQQNAIDTFDLQLQKASVGLDPIAQGVVDAAREYLKVRAEGEADLQLAEKQLKLELQGIDQEVSRYKLQVEDRVSQMAIQRDEFSRDVSRSRLQIERQIGDYVVQIEEYRLAMAKHRYEVEIDLEKKKQIVAQEGLAVQAEGGYTGTSVDGFPITSRPGKRWGETHAGVDIAAPTGTALGYEMGGKVLSAGWIAGYGNTLKVALDNGMTVLSGHLDEIFVKVGQRFEANQRLAAVGSTGRSTGPHTHQESWMNGKADPYASLPFLQLGKAVSSKADPDIYLQEGVGYFSRKTGRMVRGLAGGTGQAASAGAAAQVSSGAVGAAPVAPAPPAMPALPTAPQLVGINDLMQQYLGIMEKIKAATVGATTVEKQRLEVQSEAARFAFEQQVLAPILQYKEQNRELEFEIQKRKERNRLAFDGVAPELIEGEMRVLEITRDLNSVLTGLEATTNQAVRAELERLKLNPKLVDGTFRLTEATLADLIATTEDVGKQEELRKKLQAILDLRNKLAEKAKGEAGGAAKGARDAAEGAIVSPREKVEGRIGDLKKELTDLIDPANQVIAAADAIGGAFSESFRGVISGSMSAQEALANFFQRTADYFLDMAAQIIQKWIVMTILNQALKLFPGGGLGTAVSPEAAAIGQGSPIFAAANGAYFDKSITPFAMGGAFTNSIVSGPTLFKFAAGGVMNTGVMGEAGPEAIMPLSKGPGGRLGVDASGAGGGDISVTVNVDAKGTGVEGNQQQGAALGRVISAAVQAEIIKQQRPGGLLTR